jgi:hypothetical protein
MSQFLVLFLVVERFARRLERFADLFAIGAIATSFCE